MNDNENKEIDDVSGVETTGHEWDGLKELNNPAPRWWLWVFYVCCLWALGYWVVYPAWPTPGGATKGIAGWTQFEKLEREQAAIAQRQSQYMEKFTGAPFDTVMNDPELYAFATAGGAAAFKDNCATCHGTGGAGGRGYPNLNDDDWLWGGTVDDIYQTLSYGVRSSHEDTRLSLMPSFGKDGLMTRDEVKVMTDYVVTLSSGKDVSQHAGHAIYREKCASCHGADARGGRTFGAPNLTDGIWLYGGSREAIYSTIFNGRNGMMPFWKGRIDDNTLRQLAVYVHSLGGGEESVKPDADETADSPAGKAE